MSSWGSIPLGTLRGCVEHTSEWSHPRWEAGVFIHHPCPTWVEVCPWGFPFPALLAAHSLAEQAPKQAPRAGKQRSMGNSGGSCQCGGVFPTTAASGSEVGRGPWSRATLVSDPQRALSDSVFPRWAVCSYLAYLLYNQARTQGSSIWLGICSSHFRADLGHPLLQKAFGDHQPLGGSLLLVLMGITRDSIDSG